MSGDRLIRVGDVAPAFGLPASDRKTYALTDELRRHHVVVVFYPGNNTPG